jgi:hypothetical protein
MANIQNKHPRREHRRRQNCARKQIRAMPIILITLALGKREM